MVVHFLKLTIALVVLIAAACGGMATEESAPVPLSPPPSPETRANATPTAGRPESGANASTPVATTAAHRLEDSRQEPEPTVGRNQSPDTEPTPPARSPGLAPERLRLEPLPHTGGFESPTNMLQTHDGRFWISEQEGRIWLLDGAQRGDDAVQEVLDIRDRVSSRRTEEGLLGMAFDPDNGQYLYVYYSASNPRRSVVSRFTVDADGSRVDTRSELVILEVGQPFANHNGGQIGFGPDGYLYIGLGDGGGAGDPLGNGQDASTLLGSILRIDVAESGPEKLYSIPPDNPFVHGDGRGEIWAHGLRNPWRFSFDLETGELWAGDVGQNRWEEIDLIERRGNYGWNVLEGNHCFRPRDECDTTGKAPPVWEYSLDGEPCSVIGGYVYRGETIPWLRGAYVFGDFCSGEVFGLRYVNGEVVEHARLIDTDLRIMSFAEDRGGELYLLSQESGIYRLAGR